MADPIFVVSFHHFSGLVSNSTRRSNKYGKFSFNLRGVFVFSKVVVTNAFVFSLFVLENVEIHTEEF